MINKWGSAFLTSGLSSLSRDFQKIVDDPATVEDAHKLIPGGQLDFQTNQKKKKPRGKSRQNK
jgi:hypothetical protein